MMYYKLGVCQVFSLMLMAFSLLSFLGGLYFVVCDFSVFLDFEILSLNSCMFVMTLYLDESSLLFMGFVLFISSLVVYYSGSYMYGDSNILRFIILVLMFVLSMMFMVVSPNMISILLGWDGLGLVSYGLVIYYQNVSSYNAGMLTALSNRVGDVAILLSVAWIFGMGSWNYTYMWFMDEGSMSVVVFLILIAAMTSSAQVPFSSWLPAAMAAPTPVSALVHSSTLVTAGVFLLIRFGDFLVVTGLTYVLLYVGCITMFMAGLGANYEFDLSSIIALSTLSQLGLMMSTIGLGMFDLAYFHLLTHALFKALLFLCAGVVIHMLGDVQDIRYMGGLVGSLPLTSVCFCVSNLALCGMPFLSGFYSSDLILEMGLMSNLNLFIFFLFFLSTGLTVSYTFRMMYYVMMGDYSSFCMNVIGVEDWGFMVPMMIMAFMGVVGGSLLSWLLTLIPGVVYLPLWMKLLALVVSVIGAWIGFEISEYVGYYSFIYNHQLLIDFLGSMWFMPFLSSNIVSYGFLKCGYHSYRVVDMGWSEEWGGQGLYENISMYSLLNQDWQSSAFKIYLMSFSVWFFLLVLFFMNGLV